MMPYLLTGEPPKKGEEMMFILNHALDSTLFDLPTPFGAVPVTRFAVMIAVSVVVLTLLAFRLDRRSLVPRGALRNLFESVLLFIRDEMVRPTMGRHHGDLFVPFFCTTFMFILTMNLLGLVPIPYIGGTATSSFMVTGVLAVSVLMVGIVSGFVLHGPVGFMKTFVPGGVPPWLVPLLFMLELVGFFIKHFVLMVRLFANMLAGHLVLGAFVGLVFLAKAYWAAAPSVALALFQYGLELLVAFIQAYVFTLLSVLFVGGVVHPEH